MSARDPISHGGGAAGAGRPGARGAADGHRVAKTGALSLFKNSSLATDSHKFRGLIVRILRALNQPE